VRGNDSGGGLFPLRYQHRTGVQKMQRIAFANGNRDDSVLGSPRWLSWNG
jgi:hypothetical protein